MGQCWPFSLCCRKKSLINSSNSNTNPEPIIITNTNVSINISNSDIPKDTKPKVNTYITMKSNINNKKEDLNNLEKQYNDMKSKSKRFYKDIKDKENYITNYREFLEEFNRKIIGLKDDLNIALLNKKYFGNLLSKEDNNELSNDIENISSKIIEMESLLEKQNNELKNLVSNFQIIQEKFNEIKNNEQNSQNEQNRKFSVDNQSIRKQIEQTEKIIKKLNENKEFYDQKKKEIENKINIMQDKNEIKVTKIKTTRKKTLINLRSNKDNNVSLTDLKDSFFEKGSELFGIKDFTKAKKILKSIYLSNNEESENSSSEEPKLIAKKWYQTCYINDEFDTNYINYELKAVGLPDGMTFTSASLFFDLDFNIEINQFEIEGKPANFDFHKNYMRFDIKLKNLESKKIHIIYKESPEKMTEGQKEMRNIYRRKYYGLSERLVGQNAKYILVNVSSFEIINFEEEFFIKNILSGNVEYQWQGKIPENGKKTVVRLSKKEAHINFHEKYTLKAKDDNVINNSSIKITTGYKYGNNSIIKYSYKSKQNANIKLDETKNIFEVDYINTNSQLGEFIMKGELVNRCKGEWKIKLTDEEIDNLVPPDYKTNKEEFKRISLDIINKYDLEHKDDIIGVQDATKIGKWVNKNIIFDMEYKGMNDKTATEIYAERKGVCHHITKLFNALMYSLGYQVIYILGYTIDTVKSFSIQDSHAWSLIKIKGKWLPFDATNGIFSGKLPVTYVFKQIGDKSIEPIQCFDKVEFEQIEVIGNFI